MRPPQASPVASIVVDQSASSPTPPTTRRSSPNITIQSCLAQQRGAQLAQTVVPIRGRRSSQTLLFSNGTAPLTVADPIGIFMNVESAKSRLAARAVRRLESTQEDSSDE